MPRHLLTIEDFSADEICTLLERASWLKTEQRAGRPYQPLVGKSLAMIFEKPSTRTRVSFELAMYQLGGHALNLPSSGSQLGRGETYADTARVLSRFVDGMMIRTFAQATLEELAKCATVPVINGLTDLAHPCQVLTDLLTIQESFANWRDLKVAYVGDGNNMAYSWMIASIVLKFPLAIATPHGYEPSRLLLKRLEKEGHRHIAVGHDPVEAVHEAHVVNTDTWVSMGQEGEGVAEKKRLFAPFQVNRELMRFAAKDAIVLHCLPAHRGEEITDEVMDGPQSRIFDQAENRLHLQKAILEKLLSPCRH